MELVRHNQSTKYIDQSMNELIKVRIFEIINNYHPRDQNVFAHILSMNNSEEELPKYTKESLQYLHRLSITNLKAYSN